MAAIDGGVEGAAGRRASTTSPVGAENRDANRRLSWNAALDLWLLAEFLYLAAVVIVLASLDIGGAANRPAQLSTAIGWIVLFGLLSWYHRAVQAQVVRTDRLKQAFIDWAQASVVTLIVAFMIGRLPELSRAWALATFVGGASAIGVAGAAARAVISNLSRDGTLGERIAIYGCTEKTDDLISLIEGGSGPVATVRMIYDQRNRGGRDVFGGLIVGRDLDEFIVRIKRERIDTVIIDLPWNAVARIDELVKRLEQISVNISMAPVTLDLEGAKQSVTYVGGKPTLSLYRRRITGLQAFGKVVLDRVVAALGLLILAVPLSIIALIIKLDSPGPVLFRQKRRGMNNEPFDMLKFRSMHTAAADANADKLVTKGDSRVTRVGAVLRRTSIDELPQLVNVLLGQMSLVGPRPHAYGAKAADRLYEEVVRRYPARHRVLPGITGLAQVRGFRGNTETERDIVNRVESDIEYIDRWTLALDIQILFRTAATFLFQSGAY